MSNPTHRQPAAPCGGHGAKLPRRQEQAIAALLAHGTVAEAAAAAGVGERTLRGWMQQPDFSAAYRDARQRLVSQAIGNLHANCAAAAKALADIAGDEMAPAPARVSACRAILESSFRGAELLELEQRLAALEAQLAERTTK